MNKSFYTVFIGVFFSFCLTSCLKEKASPSDSDCFGAVVDYEIDIKPLINQSCATNLGPGTGCHDAWIFEYQNVYNKISDGSWENRVLDLKDMPVPGNMFNIDPLTNDELIMFKCWIDAGFPE